MLCIRNCEFEEFVRRLQSKRLVCFGAGKHGEKFCNTHKEAQLEKYIDYFVDNHAIEGSEKRINLWKFPIFTFEEFRRKDLNNKIILITNFLSFYEIVEQLDACPEFDGVDCYITVLIDMIEDTQTYQLPEKGVMHIPKKIHYCWFGGTEIPDNLRAYMRTWEKYCPDYELIRWDENNYDVTKNQYMYEAYQAKKWGFVSDYARLDIVYQNGGVYLDTDVELLKPLDDFLYDRMFCGFEAKETVNLGLGFGAEKSHPWLKEMLDAYETIHFIKEDGSFNLTTCSIYQTRILKNYWLTANGTYQRLREGISVYPLAAFCPQNYWGVGEIGDAYATHHFTATWFDDKMLKDKEEETLRYQKLFARAKDGEKPDEGDG